MTSLCCPACNLPFALVGRVHRCVPRPAPVIRPAPEQETAGSSQTTVSMEGFSAGTQAIGAYQVAMGVTPPSTGDRKHLKKTANRDEPALNSNVVQIRKPKRDRAKYMRDYRARVKNRKAGGGAA